MSANLAQINKKHLKVMMATKTRMILNYFIEYLRWMGQSPQASQHAIYLAKQGMNDFVPDKAATLSAQHIAVGLYKSAYKAVIEQFLVCLLGFALIFAAIVNTQKKQTIFALVFSNMTKMKAILVFCFAFLLIATRIGDSSADQCNSCKKIFNFISNITHNANENVKNNLAELCSEYSHLPGKQAEIWCSKALVGFFQLMNKNLNTTTVCYDINACADDSENGVRELTKIGKKEDCDFCYFITTQVKEMLIGGPTEVEIRTILEDGCHYLQSFENECLNIVKQYADDLFAFVNQTFQPMQLCKSLHVCTTKTGPLSMKPIYIPSAAELANILPSNLGDSELFSNEKISDINCEICKKIVKIIQRQLKDNATDQQVINVLTEACELAPAKERSKCKTVVTDYARKLIEVLTQDIDSNMACTLVGLCVPHLWSKYFGGTKHTSVPVASNKNVICVECQLITHFIQNELYDFKNEEQIEEFIKNHFCKKIGMFVNENNCNKFVQEYGPIILQTIAQEIFDPTTFCFKEIHVCSGKPTSEDIIKKPDGSYTDRRCQMCKEIVNSLNNIESHNIELEHLIGKSCGHLPTEHRVECDLMMKAFAPYFFDMLNYQDGAHDICKSIDICMVPGNVHLLGGHKCTYGPSYWCHTADHANACNASSYCRQKVWKAIK